MFLWLLLLAVPARADEITSVCNVSVRAGEKIDFTSTETKWLCGDAESGAWKEIPLNEQRALLTSFLQSRGYHRPKFEVRGHALEVDAGGRSVVEKFTVEGAPIEWNWAKRRREKGSLLNPAHLDAAVTYGKRALQISGYPCPNVEANAFLDTGEILLKASPGPKQRFGPVDSQGTSDMDPRILERFTAFYPDDFFDLRLLELTSTRILQEDLYLSTFYDVVCDNQQSVKIVRRFVPAAPRLLTFGVGFDTEQGPIARIQWKRTRLTKKADSLEAKGYASFREQQATVTYRNHFPSDPGSRLEFDPMVGVDRDNEETVHSVTYSAEPALATSWELRGSRLAAKLGPQLKRVDTEYSKIPVDPRVDTLRLVGSLGWMSHFFEYYAGEPQEGYNLGVDAWTQAGRLLSQKTIHRLLLRHELLFNLGGWDPPLLVLGWRGYEGTFFYNPRDLLVNDVAPVDRFFLGGDDNIRGFGRQKLAGRLGIGYLSVVYEGFELRAVDWLPHKIQPFLFFDFARAGMATESIDSPLFTAPGVGVRWSSPVGTLRASLARGFSSRQLPEDPVPNLQFFVSFGKEF